MPPTTYDLLYCIVLTWINFLTLLFWLSTGMLLVNPRDLVTTIPYFWVDWDIQYSYTAVVGTINDDVVLTSTSFFLLALAGLEFCIGFIITIFYRNFKKSFGLDTAKNPSRTNSAKDQRLGRRIWSLKNNLYRRHYNIKNYLDNRLEKSHSICGQMIVI